MSAQASLLDVPATATRAFSFVFNVLLEHIEEAPGFNPRSDYGEYDNTFAALVESVRARGILQPPLLRPTKLTEGGRFGLRWAVVAGHRRIAAAREAGLTELHLAAVIEPTAWGDADRTEEERARLEAEALAAYTERERLLDALTENSLRRDLNPMEQAKAARRLAEMGLDQEAIGKAFGGKSQTWVSRTLSLLELHPAISCHLVNGSLTREHGVELLRLKDFPDGIVSALANKAIEEELSVAAVRGLASTMIERRDGKAQPSLLEEKPVELTDSVNPTNAVTHTPATEAPAPVRHEAPARGESDTRHSVENQRASAEATRTLEVGPRPAPAQEQTELEKWAVGAFGGVQSALGVLRTMDSRVTEGLIYIPDDEMVFRLGRLVEHRRAEGPEFANVLAAQVLDGLIYRRCVELDLEGAGENATAPENSPTSSESPSQNAPYSLDEKSVEGAVVPAEFPVLLGHHYAGDRKQRRLFYEGPKISEGLTDDITGAHVFASMAEAIDAYRSSYANPDVFEESLWGEFKSGGRAHFWTVSGELLPWPKAEDFESLDEWKHRHGWFAEDEAQVDEEHSTALDTPALDGFKGCMAAIRSSLTPKRLEQLFSGRDSERVQAVRWVCNLLELEKYEEPTVEEWNLARDYLLGHADVMPAPFELRGDAFHKAILNGLKMSNTEAHVTASMSYGEMIDALSKRMSEGGGQSGPKNGWWGVDWKGGTKPKLELSWRWIKPDGEYSESKSVTLTGKNLYEAIVAALNWKASQ
jgi:ParB-like chromosome segregation protein Spo0J